LLARQRAAVGELQAEDRLAGAGDSRDEQAGPERDAVAEKLVQLGGARLEALRVGGLAVFLAEDGDARREHLDAVPGDDERVLVAAVAGPAQLADLDEALLLAGLLALVEPHQAVDDGEER